MSKTSQTNYIRPQWQDKAQLTTSNNAAYIYPKIPDFNAIIYMVITIIILAYSGILGIYSILLFYLIWVPHFFYKGQLILRPSKDVWAAFLLVFLCLFSILWSEYRDVTARAAFEFASMIMCTIVIARTVSIQAFIKGITFGSAIVLVLSLINGKYGLDYFSGTYSLIGLFGSKNQIGFIAEIGMYAAILLWFTKIRLTEKMLFSIGPFFICIICLFLSKSASSTVTLIFALTVAIVAYLVTKCSQRFRIIILIEIALLTMALLIVSFCLGLQDNWMQLFGKDATLTGRTYLWSEGLKIGMNNPILGYGYSAFWVPGQPQAERYWDEFFISNRSGFHFHNLFIQSFVDLGVIGFLLTITLVLINCAKSFSYTMNSAERLNGIFALGIASMFLMRSFVEVDYLGPFGVGCLLFFSILPRLPTYDVAKKSQE
jgi:exopolysaccharide production protein ExoQ